MDDPDEYIAQRRAADVQGTILRQVQSGKKGQHSQMFPSPAPPTMPPSRPRSPPNSPQDVGQPPHIPAECPVCQQQFSDKGRLRIHQEGTGHCFCALHDTTFASTAELGAHRNDEDHDTGVECEDCGRQYRTEEELEQHLSAPAHSYTVLKALADASEVPNQALDATVALATEEATLRCEECNTNHLDVKQWVNHKKNKKHMRLVNLKCPLSEECAGTFEKAQDFVYHLQSGQCKSGVKIGNEKTGDRTTAAMGSLSLSDDFLAQDTAEIAKRVAYQATVEDGDDNDSHTQVPAGNTTKISYQATVVDDTDSDDEETVFVLTESAGNFNKVADQATVEDDTDEDDEEDVVVFEGRGIKEEEILFKPRGTGK